MHLPGHLPGVHLERGPERAQEADALAEECGGRVGLDGVLADLNRVAEPAYGPGTGVTWAFAWDREDTLSPRWWPQGITTSADGHAAGTYAGREVVITSSYSKALRGLAKGARISVVDVTDRSRLRYRHVLLVEPTLGPDGALSLRPVPLHAGGIVWAGDTLYVAGTARGMVGFDLRDIVRLDDVGHPSALGRLRSGGLSAFGHRYALPVRSPWTAHSADGVERVRYSFVSLDRGSPEGPRLVAGEYGRDTMTTRLLCYDLDPETLLPTLDDAARATPAFLHDAGVARMQGAVVAHGRCYLTTSAGRFRRGSLWVADDPFRGEGANPRWAPRRHKGALPVGPEDVSYAAADDVLWTLSEYPGARVVVTLDRSRFD